MGILSLSVENFRMVNTKQSTDPTLIPVGLPKMHLAQVQKIIIIIRDGMKNDGIS
jgi:hypothetical protein